MGFQDMTIESDGASLKVTVGANPPEYVHFQNIQSINGNHIDFATQTTPEEAESSFRKEELYPYPELWRCTLEKVDGTSLHWELSQVTNQPGWTPDAAGMAQCLADVNSWIP